jgi:hypothetical protein
LHGNHIPSRMRDMTSVGWMFNVSIAVPYTGEQRKQRSLRNVLPSSACAAITGRSRSGILTLHLRLCGGCCLTIVHRGRSTETICGSIILRCRSLLWGSRRISP